MFENLSTEELIEVRASLYDDEQNSRTNRQQVELTLRHRMEDTGATAIPHPLYNIKLDRGTPKIDLATIGRIWELADHYGIPPEEMAKAYIPAHMQEVPARWDLRYLKPLGKYGSPIAALIKASVIRGETSIKFESKKEK